MSLNEANELSGQGKLLEAEDLYWQEIEAGNTEARLFLAYSFHDAGLCSLALEQYVELKGTDYWEAAAPQVSEIYLDVLDFKHAREALKGLKGEKIESSIEAIVSVETKTAGYLNEIPGIVEAQLQDENGMLQVLSQEAHLATQIQLMQTREYLAHYATVLSSDLGKQTSAEAIQVNVDGLMVSRSLGISLGAPARRWFEAAHAAVNAFTLLHEQHPEATEDFEKLTVRAMTYIEKKYVIGGRKLTEVGEDFAVNNLIWALNSINSPAKDFYSHLLPDA